MGMTSVLVKETNEQGKDLNTDSQKTDINVLVKSASRVIAPLWPIATFAARHPWMGLETQSFEQVARWLKNTRDVDIYPSASMIQSAKDRGEIDETFLELGLQRWLSSHSMNIPREMAERFCRASIKLDPLPTNLMSSPELHTLVDGLSVLNPERNPSMKPLSSYVKNQNSEKIVNILDHHMIKWCKFYLDDSQAGWTMPNREKGFYHAWQQLISHDPALSKGQRNLLKDWPQEAHVALTQVLSALEIPESERQSYLEDHLLSLPGWAGMMLWRSQQSSHERSLLTEYLAVRISMEWVFIKPYLPIANQQSDKEVSVASLLAAWIHWGNLTIEEWTQMSNIEQNEYLTFAYRFDETMRRKLWLEAWEQTYTEQLSEKIHSKQSVKNDKKTLAQFAFCIDVRSEPFRRKLEKEGPFETIGIAGFFGLPIATSELGSTHCHSSLPVILKPQHTIKESADTSELKQYQQRKQVANSLGYTFHRMKQNVFASLLLPEISGPWLSLQMVARSFVPRRANGVIRNLREAWLRKPDTKISLQHVHDTEADIPVGFSEEEKVNYARQALSMMGLTKNFAPLVVICGHGSQSTNNPYAAALDCGACGGAAGGFNARVLAVLCNLHEVRESLYTEGIEIPEDTVFVAAEHKTTVDDLHWLYVPKLSQSAQEAFDHINAVLPKVSNDANAERLSQLPNYHSHFKNPKTEAHRFAEDWSEIRPEWGLARNAAFIIGQRDLTEDCNLEGRAFLHSYDWRQDHKGDLLANIIAGPGTVAQWINLQYYASTVAPHYYGSGNKATQTVTASLGVMQGNASDLLSGFPWQSVMKSDNEAYHSPLRLLVVIQAPREYVERLLNHDPTFSQKVENGWIRLATVNQEGYWENW
ncbi:DUF2309 domain-containing protein [Halalkalibacter sp. AB-rgal2]|uniref:DUF2309 domain-containing protein n=1 Tax=Halalkalibacter sp. AB-rgal2 TaxID=3242695 RepID=UPI00359E47EE